MATTMNVSLTPELIKLIQSKVESGMYSNASEFVREAVRTFEYSQEYLYSLKMERLKAALADGISQLESNNSETYTLGEVMEEIENGA